MVPELLSHAELATAIKSATGDREIQMLLDQVSGRRRFLQLYAYGPDPVVMTLRRIASDFRYSGRDVATFVQVAKDACIPIVPVSSGDQKSHHRYWIFAAQHDRRVRDTFHQEPQLKRFLKDPLTQVIGPPIERLKTRKIEERDGFKTLTHLFLELGIGTMRHPRFQLADLLSGDCPVPIYKLRQQYFHRIDDQESLRVFLQNRRDKLERLSEAPVV